MNEELEEIVTGQIVEPPVPPAHERLMPGGVTNESPPVSAREALALVLLVILCDVTIYRGQGMAGLALLFIAAPALLAFGAPRPRAGMWLVAVALMLLAIAARTIWCGSGLQVTVGFVLLVAFAMSLAGACPHVLGLLVYASQAVVAGGVGLYDYGRSINHRGPQIGRAAWLGIVLPAVAFLLFSVIFVLANPDLQSELGEYLQKAFRAVQDWFANTGPSPLEILFWCAALWISVGLLRPIVRSSFFDEAPADSRVPPILGSPSTGNDLYIAFRNTLLTVICLFAAYLVFEFKTLWFRELPVGFYYAGYAHEGAAWLTLALALATAILSFVFRGVLLRDGRLPILRRLAWIWSAENFLLAAAVYNRLFIYINFNGMTRMRIIGIFGMSAVVVGFVLVLWKIAHNHNLSWLLRRHLWTLAMAIILFSLIPVDAIWVRYNVWRVMSGDLAPSVQIEYHPIDDEGILWVEPLLRCEDATIREGVKAMLAAREVHAESVARQKQEFGWTATRWIDDLLLQRLRQQNSQWKEYKDPVLRDRTLERFHDYAYQWF